MADRVDSSQIRQLLPLCPISNNDQSQIAYNIWCNLNTANAILHYEEKHPLLMKYFIALLGCMQQMELGSDGIYKSVIGSTMHFSSKVNSKLHIKYSILVHSQYSKWDVVLQCVICIAYEVFHSILQMLLTDQGDSGSIGWPLMGIAVPISTNDHSQIDYEMRGFVQYTLSTENWMLDCEEKHPLLVAWLIKFLICMQ